MATDQYSLRTIKDIGKLSDDGILVVNVSNGDILYCNKALAKIFGKTTSQIQEGGVGVIRKALKDDDKFLSRAWEKFSANSKVSNLELRVTSAQDKYISVDAYMIDRSETITAIVKDISKSKEHFNYISEFGARKDTILDMVSHNLSGPLNLTNNLLDVVDQASKGRQYPKLEEPVRLIRENTQHCIELINSLLKEEHLVSPDISVDANRFDVIAKVKVIVDRYKQFNQSKQIRIVSAAKELFVTGDDVKFFQIVNNLLSNSMKFTDANGKVVVEIKEGASVFSIVVRDNGIGIPEYFHPHLFKRNTPAGRPGLHGEKSVGMGLYIVKKLVVLMKGTITFESEENKGSSFTVVFPKG